MTGHLKSVKARSFFLDCANWTNFMFFLNTPTMYKLLKNIFYTDNVKIISLFLIFICAIYSDVPKLMQLFPDVIVTHQISRLFKIS